MRTTGRFDRFLRIAGIKNLGAQFAGIYDNVCNGDHRRTHASLTIARRVPLANALANQFSFVGWPSVALALDLLAWDVFLGMSLLFAAIVFAGERRVQAGLFLTAGLCLGGAAGPLQQAVLRKNLIGISFLACWTARLLQ